MTLSPQDMRDAADLLTEEAAGHMLERADVLVFLEHLLTLCEDGALQHIVTRIIIRGITLGEHCDMSAPKPPKRKYKGSS